MEIDWGIDVGAMAEDDGAEDGSGKGAAVAIDWEIDAVTDGTEGDGTGGEQQPVIEIDWDFAMDVEGEGAATTTSTVESGWDIVAEGGDGGADPSTTCTAARLLDAEFRNRYGPSLVLPRKACPALDLTSGGPCGTRCFRILEDQIHLSVGGGGSTSSHRPRRSRQRPQHRSIYGRGHDAGHAQ